VHPEGDDLVLGGAKGLSAARVSSIANLHGVTSRLDWYLDRVVHFDRPDPLTVDHDIVRATTDSAPMALCVNFSVADTCRSPLISERRFFLREIIRRDEEGPASELPREIEEAFSGAALEPHIRGIWRQIADAVAEYGPEPSGEQIFGKGYESDAWDAPVWSSTETVRLLGRV
jgi:hypothetical protein